MNQIICSSRTLYHTLYNYIGLEREEEFVKIVCRGSQLIVDGFSIEVYSKHDWDIELSLKTIKQIKKVLKRVPEQPLTICFLDGGIEIRSICI